MNFINHNVAIVNKRGILSLLQRLCINLVYEQPVADPHGLVAHVWVLGVQGNRQSAF